MYVHVCVYIYYLDLFYLYYIYIILYYNIYIYYSPSILVKQVISQLCNR
jgi:hypothetical protein